jgi:hypothetical protein
MKWQPIQPRRNEMRRTRGLELGEGWRQNQGDPSIRDLFSLANGSTEAAIRDIAAAGYAGVEMFYGNLRQHEDRPGDLRNLIGN